MVTLTDDKDDEIFIGKITDITSTIIRLIISILKLLKINTPKSAESGIGLITLLIFIYWSADILKLDKSTHMLIFYAIFMIVMVEIIGYNSSTISKILNRGNKIDSIIKEIVEGNITSEQAYTKISKSNLNAENIDSLLNELTDKNMLSEKIQKAIINSQSINIKNIHTLFNENSSILLTDESILELLSQPEIKGALNEEYVMKIYKNYKHSPQIIAELMLSQSIAKKLLFYQINYNTKMQFEINKKYLDKPLFIDKHFNKLNSTIRIALISIYFSPVMYVMIFSLLNYGPQSEISNSLIVLFVLTIIFANIYKNILDFVGKQLDCYVTDKVNLKLAEYKNSA